MPRTAIFKFNGKQVVVKNVDACCGVETVIDKPWADLQQATFDQLDDSGEFTKEEILIISCMNTDEYLGCFEDQAQ